MEAALCARGHTKAAEATISSARGSLRMIHKSGVCSNDPIYAPWSGAFDWVGRDVQLAIEQHIAAHAKHTVAGPAAIAKAVLRHEPDRRSAVANEDRCDRSR